MLKKDLTNGYECGIILLPLDWGLFFCAFFGKVRIKPRAAGQAFLKLISFAGEGGNGNGHKTIT